MGSKNNTTSAREAREARKALAAARSGGRRASVLWIAASVAVIGALLAVVIIGARNHRGPTTAAPANNAPAAAAVGATTMPPWPAPADASAAATAAGLPMLGSEGSVEHIHAHIDVIINGHPESVPAGIGIDRAHRLISPLHTHDTTGVIHIESPVKRAFSLGEFFTEWQVSLSADNIGALQAGDGKSLRVFVNGNLQTVNPAAITIGAHDEIAIVYGSPQPGETVPTTYTFPADE